MGAIACFLLDPTGGTVRQLRRFVSSGDESRRCPVRWYHDAVAGLDRVDGVDEVSGDLWAHDDPRWPTRCVCGYEFREDDHWQLFCQLEYRRSDTGETTTIRDAPVGAMWWANWLWDSPHLIMKTPDGEWDIDSSTSGKGGWTREGVPPKVTARPSIQMEKYHGVLTDGFLVEC